MATSFKGSHALHRNGGITYEYASVWANVNGQVFWDCFVFRNGKIVLTPGGAIPEMPAGADPTELVRLEVQAAIEAADDVLTR